MDDIQQQVNEEEIATFYNKVEEIWPSNEPWYAYSGGYPFSISGDIRSVPS